MRAAAHPIAIGLVAAGALAAAVSPAGARRTDAAAGPALPIAPRLLVLPRLEVPGYAHARRHLGATASAAYWARELIGDSPVEAVVEVGRLGTEGFAEGVEAVYQGRRQAAFAAALVLGSAASAQAETREKVREEALGFGPGAIAVPAAGPPGAVMVEQPHGLVSAVRGRRLVSVLFAAGRCTLAVGAPIARPVARTRARGAILAAASELYRRALGACSAPSPA